MCIISLDNVNIFMQNMPQNYKNVYMYMILQKNCIIRDIDGLVLDCGIWRALAMKSSTKSSIYLINIIGIL